MFCSVCEKWTEIIKVKCTKCESKLFSRLGEKVVKNYMSMKNFKVTKMPLSYIASIIYANTQPTLGLFLEYISLFLTLPPKSCGNKLLDK